MKGLENNLEEVVSMNMRNELKFVKERIFDSIVPYTRFIRSQQESMIAQRDRLENLRNEAFLIRSELRKTLNS